MKIDEIEDSLDIPRDNLPQIDFKQFDNILEKFSKEGISYKTGTVPCQDLKPVQDKLNLEKVNKMIKDSVYDQDRTLFISKEGFIIDGHHYWAACLEKVPEKEIKVVLMLKNIVDCINWFNSTSFVENKSITEGKKNVRI